MIIGNREYDTTKNCFIMGILNVTPDSFSDGGKFQVIDSALRQAEKMVEEGADIIDVGGESTRPGYKIISQYAEIDRVTPVIDALQDRFDVPISIDSYKSAVAMAALEAGAVLVNDIWGLKHDNEMAEVIARSGASCCLMHNRHNMDYTDFMSDMLDDMAESLRIADRAAIPRNKIILDPGIGFAKTYEMNLLAINKLDMMHKFGLPILLGTSRKSVIGLTLDVPVDDRIEGTIATTVIGIMRGCSFVRVHDVKEIKRTVVMAKAVLTA